VNTPVKVGTCGFGRVKRPDYVKFFPVVEIQHTFYHPPEIKTLEKWRASFPDDFECTLKAWQMITHESSSPTYKRLKRPLTDKETEEAGFFKPTDTVRDALQLTLRCAKALKARTILFQCPAKFQPLPENILNMKQFFASFDRTSLNCIWEPRGKMWEPDLIRDLCEELDLWDCVNPFQRPTTTPQNCYFRLHGQPRWRYTYDDDELYELATLPSDGRLSYVFFNNITMKQDAERFLRVLGERTE
jgi:uncharacterized protein YecE (DUF72 family)